MNCLFSGYLDCTETFCQYGNEIALILHQNPQRILSHRIIYKILSLFEKWSMCSRNCRSEGFGRQVLHYVARRVFWSQLKDGDCIAKLMVLLYNMDSHFGFFLCPETDMFPFVSGHDCDDDSFLSFFLHHAHRQRLTINNKRVVDLLVFHRSTWLHPCEVAIALESPALLHALLKYGSLIAEDSATVRGLLTIPAFGNINVIVLSIVKAIIEGLSYDRDSECRASRYDNIVRCGCLMQRACPQIEKTNLGNFKINFAGYSSEEEAFRVVEKQGLSVVRCRIENPLPLKHACRLKIRSALHQNWQLPFGIDRLLIPNRLKDYLNLEFD